MPARVAIADQALFDDRTLGILREFDSYVRTARVKGHEPTVVDFHSRHGEKLNFSRRSLQRWLEVRRRYAQSRQDWREQKRNRQ